MSVLLSWHEKVRPALLTIRITRGAKRLCVLSGVRRHVLLRLLTLLQLVEIAGPGSIVRVMTDRRTV